MYMQPIPSNKLTITLIILSIFTLMTGALAQQHAQVQAQVNPTPTTHTDAAAATSQSASGAPIIVEPEIVQQKVDDVVQPVIQANVVDPIATDPAPATTPTTHQEQQQQQQQQQQQPQANTNTATPNPQTGTAVPNLQITAQVNPVPTDPVPQANQNSNQAQPNQQQQNQQNGATQQVQVQVNHNIVPEHAQQQADQTFQKNQAMGQGNQGQTAQATQPQAQNFDEPNPERSARYRAEQQRIMEIRRRQQQLEQQQKQQERLRQVENQKFSRTEKARQTQRQNLHKVMAEDIGMNVRKSVLFEVDKKIQEFYLNPTEQTDIILKLSVYVLKDNAYGMVKDVDTAGLIKLYVYEDNNRIVGQAECFFMAAVLFKAKPKSTYTVRFYNDGITKLISLTFPEFVSTSTVQNLYSQSKRHLHIWKTEILGLRIRELTDQLRLNSMMDFHNASTLIQALRLYSFYQFLEILVVLGLAGAQVFLVKKMFKNDCIL